MLVVEKCYHWDYLADYAGCCRMGQIPLYPSGMFMCLFEIVNAYKHVSQKAYPTPMVIQKACKNVYKAKCSEFFS